LLQVVTLPSSTDVPDVHDDLTRELAFYNQGRAAAQEAIRQFEGARVVWHRPADYYAESVKSDGHMAKVKQQLMHEQQLIEEAEQRYAQVVCMPLPVQGAFQVPA
jgi:rRNA-processing protein EBP2